MSILSIRALTASTADNRPRRSRTAMPFGCKAKAAPTSYGRSARSTSVTRAATRLSTKLAVSPPIPAPTTTAWSTIHTVDTQADADMASWPWRYIERRELLQRDRPGLRLHRLRHPHQHSNFMVVRPKARHNHPMTVTGFVTADGPTLVQEATLPVALER